MSEIVHGLTPDNATGNPLAVRVESLGDGLAGGTMHVTLDGGAIGGSTVKQGDDSGDASKPWYVRLYDGASNALAAAIGDDVPAAALLTAVKNASGKLTALTLGRAAAASSLPVALSTEDAAKVPSLGQAAMASSVPVAIASNQSTVPVSLSATDAGVLALRRYKGAVAVSPDNSNDLSGGPASSLFVGTGGDVKIKTYALDGTTDADVVYTAVPSGSRILVPIRRVYATGTTASNLVAES